MKAFRGSDNGVIRDFMAYGTFTGGGTVAYGDVNGDGIPDMGFFAFSPEKVK